VILGECAPAKKRDAERAEVRRAHDDEVNVRLLARSWLWPIWKPDPTIDRASQGYAERCGSGVDARQRGESLEHTAVEFELPRRVCILPWRHGQLHGEKMLSRKSQVYMLHVDEARDQQARTCQQQLGERELGNHECITEATLAASLRRPDTFDVGLRLRV